MGSRQGVGVWEQERVGGGSDSGLVAEDGCTYARSKTCSQSSCGSPGLLRFVPPKLVVQLHVNPLGLLQHYPGNSPVVGPL